MSFHFRQSNFVSKVGIWNNFCSVLRQFSRPVTQKSGLGVPLIEREDLRSSTDSTISTSLIHSLASVGNCELVLTSVLNLIFQQANVAGLGNLSK